jgi:hypothetical protein
MVAFVIFPLFVLASVAMEVVAARRCQYRIQQWAAASRFQVASVNRLWLSTGTWGFWRGGRSRRYFNVAVSDRTLAPNAQAPPRSTEASAELPPTRSKSTGLGRSSAPLVAIR